MGTIINVIFYQPIFNLLMVLYDLVGGNLGIAIILVAAIAKLVTIPITRKQLKSAEEMKKFQEETQAVKKKYAKNSDKMNEELMKLSSKYMPAQLGGCLPLIIAIILLIQVRGVVVNLVNEGYHAFNEVAYMESIEKEEDSIKYIPSEELPLGEHEIKVVVGATNGVEIEKTYTFEITDNRERRLQEIEVEEKFKSEEERAEKIKAEEDIENNNRKSSISIFNKTFEDKKSESKEEIVLGRSLLIFPSEVKTVNLFESNKPEIDIYIRPPSQEFINSVEIYLNDENVTDNADIKKGESLNLEFIGIDLSKVGLDYLGEWGHFTPYLILALLLAFSQFIVSKIQMGIGSLNKKEEPKKKEEKKKKKDESEEPDFSEIMQQSSKQMIYFMPIFSVMMSLGYLGGANIFPSAVSVFWTAQNSFVIIQLVFTKKEEIKELVHNQLNKKNIKKERLDDYNEVEEAIIIEDIKNDKKNVSKNNTGKNKKKNDKNKKKRK